MTPPRLLARARAALRRRWLRYAPRTFLRLATPDRAELGLAGEELAARALAARGYRLLGKRVDAGAAEVDLWARRADTSWVVEVKCGRRERLPRLGAAPAWDLRWRPGRSLDPAQRRRLERAARRLAAPLGLAAGALLVEVLVEPERGRAEVLEPVAWFHEPPLGARARKA